MQNLETTECYLEGYSWRPKLSWQSEERDFRERLC